MLNPALIPIEELVPHAGKMCLLDKVLHVTDTTLIAELTPTSEDLFCQDGQIGAWVGIEYMAQAIAAWAGYHARLKNQKPRIGLLLGSRHYESKISHFALEETLKVLIELQFRADNGLGQFSCRILRQDHCLASAELKVFEQQE